MKNIYRPDPANPATLLITVRYRTQSLTCLVDADDLPKLKSRHVTWYANPDVATFRRLRSGVSPCDKVDKFYVQTKLSGHTVLLHRFLLDAPGQLGKRGPGDRFHEIHHKNNNGLDNRRDNLEFITHPDNLRAHWPGRDWTAVDAKRQLADEYRLERRIATSIGAELGLTRAALWKVRSGQTKLGRAGESYRSMCAELGVRTFDQLRPATESDDQKKWGVDRSGRGGMSQPW